MSAGELKIKDWLEKNKMEKHYQDLDNLKIYMDFYIQSLINIYKNSHNLAYHDRTAKRMIAWIPQFGDLSLTRQYSESYYLNGDGTVSVMHMGVGYRDDAAFMRREYCMKNGVAYNISKPEIRTDKISEYRKACVHEFK